MTRRQVREEKEQNCRQSKLGEPNRSVAAGGKEGKRREGKGRGTLAGCMTDARDFVGKCISQLEAAFPPSFPPSFLWVRTNGSLFVYVAIRGGEQRRDRSRSLISMAMRK